MDEDGDSWLQVTRRLPILPTLFTTLEVSQRVKQNLYFTEAALHLLLTLARTQQVGAGRGAAGLVPVGADAAGVLPAQEPPRPGGCSDSARPLLHPPRRGPQPWPGPASPRAFACLS